MSEEATPGDVVNAPTQLIRVINESSLASGSQLKLLETFQPHFNAVRKIVEKSQFIIVNDATQIDQIKAAKAARLELKKHRLAADKERAELKEDYLRTGQAIDKVAGVIKSMAQAEELRLEEQEKFAERQETARKSALNTARTAELQAVGVADPSFYGLGDMPDETYAKLLAGHRDAHIARLEAQKAAIGETARAREEARIKDEQRAEEEKRLRAENERLEAERLKAEEAARIERERREAEAKDLQRQWEERTNKEKAEADERARQTRIEADLRAVEQRRLADEQLKKERDARAAAERERTEAAERQRKAEKEAQDARDALAAREKADAERKAKEDAEARRKDEEAQRARETAAMAPPIDTTNDFAVGVQEGVIVFPAKPLPRRMARPAALRLAAYIVSLTTEDDEEFLDILAAIRNT